MAGLDIYSFFFTSQEIEKQRPDPSIADHTCEHIDCVDSGGYCQTRAQTVDGNTEEAFKLQLMQVK